MDYDINAGGIPEDQQTGKGVYMGVELGVQPNKDHVKTPAEIMFGDNPSGVQVIITGEALAIQKDTPDVPLDQIVAELVR